MRVIGIDPGASGALALLDFHGSSIEFFPMFGPVTPETAVFKWLKEADARIIGIEKVTTVKGAAATSNFKFGKNVGAIEAIARCTGTGVDFIAPKAWQKEIGLVIPQKLKGPARTKHIKNEVGRIAQSLYPGAEIFGPKGGLLDGRSDALMIAHCMGLKYGGA
jgi:hypothetical protein